MKLRKAGTWVSIIFIALSLLSLSISRFGNWQMGGIAEVGMFIGMLGMLIGGVLFIIGEVKGRKAAMSEGVSRRANIAEWIIAVISLLVPLVTLTLLIPGILFAVALWLR